MMSLRLVCVIIILLSAACDVIAQNRALERCGRRSTKNPQPWLVGIEFQVENETKIVVKCTGALIDKKHVVSSALCFTEYEPPESVRFGPNITLNEVTCVRDSDDNCIGDDATRIWIETVILHPKFSTFKNYFSPGEHNYEIALIRLRDVVSYTDLIGPICLPSSDITMFPATDFKLQLTGIERDALIQNLNAAMNYINTEECHTKYNWRLIGGDRICAAYIENPEVQRPCMLPGGLLVSKRWGSYELIGLAEYATSCLSPKIFTHMFLYLDWIRSIMPDSIQTPTKVTIETPRQTPTQTPTETPTETAIETPSGCGRRKLEHTALIMNGQATKAGDWPWHVAISKLNGFSIKYICGGTLISKVTVLTAAHCCTENGLPVNPELLSVNLGKYHLFGGDLLFQERRVLSVIVHEHFAASNYFINDIALLKLRTEASYNDYVQPACIWSNEARARLPSNIDFGTVVGWGIDQSEQISLELKQANMPRVPDLTCVLKNPTFYSKALENNRTFCAGWANGTSPCNGDSGGGFLVFVPDTAGPDSSDAIGAWYVRGLVSLSISLRDYGRCDPYKYVVFTDVDKYADWIQRHLDS